MGIMVIFIIMGSAGFISATVATLKGLGFRVCSGFRVCLAKPSLL